jgi:hypothetical protein
MAARRAARAAACAAARSAGLPEARWPPGRLGRERPDRATAGAASSADDDITDRDSIPAERLSQIAPST